MNEYKSIDLSDEAFDQFVTQHQNGDFSQLTGWGKVKIDNWYSRKVAMTKNESLVACALLLFRKVPGLPYTLCYSPRGIVMDYADVNDVKAMIDLIKSVAKQERAFTIKIDPNVQKEQYPNLVEDLAQCGFKHNGFTKGLVDAQPRFTFMVDLTKDETAILNSFNSQTRNLIRKAINNGVFCEEVKAEKLNIFWDLMQQTGSRDNISVRYFGYYQRLLESFKERGETRLFLAGFRPKFALEAAEKELKTIETETARCLKKMEALSDEVKKANFKDELLILENRKQKANQRIMAMTEYLEKNCEVVYLAGGIIVCSGVRGYYLYGASSDLFRELVPSYVMVYEMMKWAKQHGVCEYDLGGISGYTTEAELSQDEAAGLYRFKRQFGGELFERVGEFNCTLNPIVNQLFNMAMKLRGLLKK